MSIFTKILNKEYLTEKEKHMYISFFHCIEKMDDAYILNTYKEQFKIYELLSKYEMDELINYSTSSDGNRFLTTSFYNDIDKKRYVGRVIEFISEKFNVFNKSFDTYNLNENTLTGKEKLKIIKNYENILNNIVFKEFFNDDFFKIFDFNLFDYEIMFQSFIMNKSNVIYKNKFSYSEKLYKQNFDETNALFDNVNINILKKVKELLNNNLKDEKETFNYCFGLTQNVKEKEFKFDLIKRMFLNDDNLLNFKNPSDFLTSSMLSKCINFINIKSLYFSYDFSKIANDINEHVFNIIDYVHNSKGDYNDVLNDVLNSYFTDYLYLIKKSSEYKYGDLNSKYNENKIFFFNKLGVNKNSNDILNINFLLLNIFTTDLIKNDYFFIKNEKLINDEVFLSLIKNIIQNHNKITDILYKIIHAEIIITLPELFNYQKEKEEFKEIRNEQDMLDEIMNSDIKLGLVKTQMIKIIQSIFTINSSSFQMDLSDKFDKYNNDDYGYFINKSVNDSMKNTIEKIFYCMCFIHDDLFNKLKEENLFNLFIDNYQSVFKYPIDENKISYENMLTNIKNINNDLIVNEPNLNILNRLSYFTEILNDFKNTKSRKIKI